MARENDTKMKHFCNLTCRIFAYKSVGWVCLERQLLAAGVAAAVMVKYQQVAAIKPGL